MVQIIRLTVIQKKRLPMNVNVSNRCGNTMKFSIVITIQITIIGIKMIHALLGYQDSVSAVCLKFESELGKLTLNGPMLIL